MGIIIRKKQLKDASESLYFDICSNGRRYYEFLDIKLTKAKTVEQRKINKRKMEIAMELKAERELQLIKKEYKIKASIRSKDFFQYFQEYIEGLVVKDKRLYIAVLKKLKQFVKRENLNTEQIDEIFLQRFRSFLEASLNGSSPYGYFKKLKRVIKEATKEGLFRENPCIEISNKRGTVATKEILTFEEITRLTKAPCRNKEVKMAFLFSCLTGLRFCDIKNLEWKNISDDLLIIMQKKTKQPVTISLNKDSKIILDRVGKREGKIFNLPSHTGCLKCLRLWVKTANIEKHITWHCARHSFGTNLILKGVDVFTVSKLLGHRSLKNTIIYLRESEELKKEAVNKFPSVFQ